MLDWLAHRTQASPEKTALIFGDQSWTYAALNERVAVMCACLSAFGVQRGDRIGVRLANSPDYVLLIHALARIGAVIVPLNVRLTPQELDWQIKHSGLRHIVSEDGGDQFSSYGKWFRIGSDDLRPACPDAAEWQSRPLDLDAIQGIVFSSGTTGKPKGVMLTYANHLWSAQASAYRLGVLPADRWLACMPLYHVGGQAIILRACLYGITVVLQDGFDVEAVSNALDEQGITIVSLVPTMLHRLIEHRGDKPLPESVRCILLGGAAASPNLIDHAIERGYPIALTYGLTEAASQVATATPDQVRLKPGSVGKPLMFTSVRIVDAAGDDLPAGEIGEIAVSGPTVMQGYSDQPEATANVLRKGWLRTGDLGYLDSDGDLWVVQRRSDLVVCGGENVYPAEVETVLEAHPAIKEACVVGMEDAEWGQRVAAMIVRNGSSLSEDEVIAFCRERLAGYKIPRVILFADELPRTASGKIERGKVARMIDDRTFTGTLRRV